MYNFRCKIRFMGVNVLKADGDVESVHHLAVCKVCLKHRRAPFHAAGRSVDTSEAWEIDG